MFIWGVVLLAIGCQEEPRIIQYEVSRQLPEKLRPESVSQRILAAMTANEDAMWFFKMTGAPESVAKLKEPFRGWLESVEFVDGAPKWQIPEGWEKRPASGIRFATLVATIDQQSIEAAVTQLSYDGNWEPSVQVNVNRWRKQANLAESNEAYGGAETFKTALGRDFAFVDLLGESVAPTGMVPPMMSGHPPMDGMAANIAKDRVESDPSGSADVELKPASQLESPVSWRPGKPGAMRLASFEAGNDDKSVEITLIRALGDEEGNVRRWLGQIRAEVADQAVTDALKEAVEIPVSGQTAKLYRLSGDREQAIYAVIVPEANGGSLFLKMTGNLETAKVEEENFLNFAKSLPLN